LTSNGATSSTTRPSADPGERIGLLGGSFNPAHEGHLHISRMALDLLGLDAVWWLVSPQNPLKAADGMAPLAERVEGAMAVAAVEPRIVVTDIERELGTTLTVETLARLTDEYSGQRFVWLMGADNLVQINEWSDWETIFGSVPIAVFARPGFGDAALRSVAAERFANARHDVSTAGMLATMAPPAWVYLEIPMHPASATEIRGGKGS